MTASKKPSTGSSSSLILSDLPYADRNVIEHACELAAIRLAQRLNKLQRDAAKVEHLDRELR